jgi:hypothetical protein
VIVLVSDSGSLKLRSGAGHAFAGQREQPQLKRVLLSASYFFKRGKA